MFRRITVVVVTLLALASMALSQSIPTPPQASSAEVKKAKAYLDGLTKDYLKAKKAYTAKPKDAKVKQTYVAATVRLGTATMTSEALSAREKYRGALRFYREALKVDPKNKEATANKDLIESIYKQMGRPIPKD